jgi:DNA-binding MarR family transcriptional regulator
MSTRAEQELFLKLIQRHAMPEAWARKAAQIAHDHFKLDRDKTIAMAYELGMSTRQIAKQIKLRKSAIAKIVKRKNVKRNYSPQMQFLF